uniref:Uncharacterized protein n=1 Tax=Vibrio parahaemolyticus TaxID=670 RepID=A0A1Y1BA88_VIBPH|nr:hypothetical protein [Vibrio parahaemolyticus]
MISTERALLTKKNKAKAIAKEIRISTPFILARRKRPNKRAFELTQKKPVIKCR